MSLKETPAPKWCPLLRVRLTSGQRLLVRLGAVGALTIALLWLVAS